ncbi:MAG: glucose-6-phosphate dehydrogenase assembly protein OpcA [Opitutaceae bacterium]|nr:glucose-6-phosphate dehydrogenase assembly protein OpcA [Opitutaceae bacterium]MBP9913554.1 glucose-6-phosphate dehydrogenase assembly protein OpcA [Opitutaceae bacterium]
MSAIFDALPGLEVPVDAISKSLGKMWADTAAQGGPAPATDDAKATQVNFVLHLGLQATAADAAEQFQTAVRFSRRYPSRIVVLCPLAEENGETDMRAKVYGECHLGKTKGDTRCVEFVMLSYPRGARLHLEDQVSICLSTDLPLYYWAHRFSASGKLADYQYLLSRAKRVLIDSAIAPADAMTYPWPRPETLRDLVYARLLPVRQTIGQFLAGYAPTALVGGLQTVAISADPAWAAEGRVLSNWLQRRLAACGAPADGVKFTAVRGTASRLAVDFSYANAKNYFRWSGDLANGHAKFEADYGAGRTALPTSVSLLTPENALSEAMFF